MDRAASNELRRENLRKFVAIHCDGVIAQFLRRIGGELGNEAYWRAILGKGKKSFSMEKASETERKLGLLPGELLKENSELLLDPNRIVSHREEVVSMLGRMLPEEHVEMLNVGAKIIRRRIETEKIRPIKAPQGKSKRA